MASFSFDASIDSSGASASSSGGGPSGGSSGSGFCALTPYAPGCQEEVLDPHPPVASENVNIRVKNLAPQYASQGSKFFQLTASGQQLFANVLAAVAKSLRSEGMPAADIRNEVSNFVRIWAYAWAPQAHPLIRHAREQIYQNFWSTFQPMLENAMFQATAKGTLQSGSPNVAHVVKPGSQYILTSLPPQPVAPTGPSPRTVFQSGVRSAQQYMVPPEPEPSKLPTYLLIGGVILLGGSAVYYFTRTKARIK